MPEVNAQKQIKEAKPKMGLAAMGRALLRALRPIASRMLPTIAESLEVVNDFVSAAFGGLGIVCSLDGLYQAFRIKEAGRQRKTKLVAHGLGLALNVLYFVGIFLGKLINNMSLGFIALANSFVSLCGAVYVAYQARKVFQGVSNDLQQSSLVVDAPIALMQAKLKQEEQYYFRSKVDVAYNLGLIVAALFFTLSFIAPPLFFVGVACLSTLTLFEIIDRNTDLSLSRCLSPSHEPVSDAKKSNHSTHYFVAKGLPSTPSVLSTVENSVSTSLSEDNRELSDSDEAKALLAEEHHASQPASDSLPRFDI